jgi:hypothetical protein
MLDFSKAEKLHTCSDVLEEAPSRDSRMRVPA